MYVCVLHTESLMYPHVTYVILFNFPLYEGCAISPVHRFLIIYDHKP